MSEKVVRIGRVSSIDMDAGMVSVTYPDLDGATTGKLPLFSMGDEYKMPGIGQEVLVLHLSNGQSAGVVMGKYWNKRNMPPESGAGVFHKELGEVFGEAYMHYESGRLKFHDGAGSFSVATIKKILKRLDALDGQGEEQEE